MHLIVSHIFFTVVSLSTQLCSLFVLLLKAQCSPVLMIVASLINTVSVPGNPVPCPPALRLIPYPHPFLSLVAARPAALEPMWIGETLRLQQMARAALIQSHCCRMNTSSESPERVEKREFEESKREIERVIEFPPCVWENKGKQGRVNMHEGKSNCVREGTRDNKRGEWTKLNCRLRDFFPSRPLLFICYRTTPPSFHLSVCLYQGTGYERAHLYGWQRGSRVRGGLVKTEQVTDHHIPDFNASCSCSVLQEGFRGGQ